MNDSFVILTDSTSNLPVKYVEKHGIRVLPLRYLAGDREYPGYDSSGDGNFHKLYAYLRAGKQITTSMVNQEEAYEISREIVEEGRDILYIGLSSKLSGTCHAVESALQRIKGEYPRRQICSIDSLCVALGEGLLVQGAVQRKKQNKSLQAVYEWCSRIRWEIKTIFTVDDLNYLRRSGRASAAIAMVGSALKIKPILRMGDGGVLRQEGKVRGRKKALDQMIRCVTKELKEEQIVCISHGDCYEDALYLAEKLRLCDRVKNINIQLLDPVIGVHTGPGSIGVFFH